MRWVFLVLVGCRTTDKAVLDFQEEESQQVVDGDGDGYLAEEDCDDSSSTSHPGAIELCDGIDNNCDGQIDEGVTNLYYADTDGDGYGALDNTMEACDSPEGYIPVGNDCDDTDANVYPSAPELCDGIDNNCDGIADDGSQGVWFPDYDNDGYGDANSPQELCDDQAGFVANGDDCNDMNPDIYPFAEEICDGLDNNCNEQIDEGVSNTFYIDSDGDGYGNPSISTQACEMPTGYVNNDSDCDDTDSFIFPTADEYCDGIDNNCDTLIDDSTAVDATWYYLDSDGDGYGDNNTGLSSCTAIAGYILDSSDCDDGNSSVYPGALEYCNMLDDDCDNAIDEVGAVGGSTYYADSDGDGFGDSTAAVSACSVPTGYVDNPDDCDDTTATVSPNAVELCNGIDDDCNALIDDGLAQIDWYADTDGDGFGNSQSLQTACSQPAGFVLNDLDCDDTDILVNPTTDEYCDGLDNNCDGLIDDPSSVDALLWYIDIDGDGYGVSDYTTLSCSPIAGWADNTDDCDDTDILVNPSATEICNGLDDDCDGTVDIGANDMTVWYYDSDGDGFGDLSITEQACDVPQGYVATGDDCDDAEAAIFPGAIELCDAIDNDCDSIADSGVVGTEAVCSGGSCLDVLMQLPGSSDGIYWIDPSSSYPYEAYCDMTTDGGGWTLLMKTSGDWNTSLYYWDPLWTNDILLNETSLNTNTSSNAKLQPFLDLPIDELNGCFPGYSHCIYADIATGQTPVDIFSGGSIQIGNNFNGQMYSGWSYQTNCRYFGINVPHSTKARFGFSANQENNCNSNDTGIGFGLGTVWSGNGTHYSSGQVCSWNGCSNGNYLYQGFPGLLWGR